MYSVVWCVIFSMCASCTPVMGEGHCTLEGMTLIEVFVKSFVFGSL